MMKNPRNLLTHDKCKGTRYAIASYIFQQSHLLNMGFRERRLNQPLHLVTNPAPETSKQGGRKKEKPKKETPLKSWTKTNK
jgi:hypothetical protein